MSEERRIVVASAAGLALRAARDVPELIGAVLDSDGLIITEDELSPDFFDLRTGLAGELFQKLVNYRIRTAVVVRDPQAHGPRFGELAYEHAANALIRFFASEEQARTWLLP